MTEKKSALETMDPESRREFCRAVLESLSDLVEGEAPEDLCRTVDKLLGDCRPFQAFRNTFEATIRAVGELGREDELPEPFDEAGYRRCVERVRKALE